MCRTSLPFAGKTGCAGFGGACALIAVMASRCRLPPSTAIIAQPFATCAEPIAGLARRIDYELQLARPRLSLRVHRPTFSERKERWRKASGKSTAHAHKGGIGPSRLALYTCLAALSYPLDGALGRRFSPCGRIVGFQRKAAAEGRGRATRDRGAYPGNS